VTRLITISMEIISFLLQEHRINQKLSKPYLANRPRFYSISSKTQSSEFNRSYYLFHILFRGSRALAFLHFAVNLVVSIQIVFREDDIKLICYTVLMVV
jgi:hypothetical protein